MVRPQLLFLRGGHPTDRTRPSPCRCKITVYFTVNQSRWELFYGFRKGWPRHVSIQIVKCFNFIVNLKCSLELGSLLECIKAVIGRTHINDFQLETWDRAWARTLRLQSLHKSTGGRIAFHIMSSRMWRISSVPSFLKALELNGEKQESIIGKKVSKEEIITRKRNGRSCNQPKWVPD